ncbi:MAG TPA: type I DNA topoisomerase [Lentisphaeria bacterium]|nr:MAG: DNA topoisomerase I [Lentisphaerae bacterium GWF2_50_93]HCE43446.1 type I DNA topoisomerase [Lentisphaeria bacterium]
MSEGKKVVIVESPAKARTISRILGPEYYVTASMGHVRDLPERTLGVDIKNGFIPIYQETKKKVIQELKAAAKGASHIYLASDPDREGEAIAWHVKEALQKSTKAAFSRVVFHEITKSAVNNAFQHPADINMDVVDSQQARRILDRLVGYKVSEILWSKIERGISAGRVQSVALRIVCEKEREVLAFQPQEYWNLSVNLEVEPQGSGKKYQARLFQIDGKKADIKTGEESNKALESIRGGHDLKIANNEIKPKKRYAPPPFITSTLQQAAGPALRFSASHTMRVAQGLYEGVDLGSSGPAGLITYMRTDSFTIAKEAQEACRAYITSSIGAEYLPDTPNFYKNAGRAQEAHEAIRPTDVNRTPKDLEPFLSPDQLKLYTLIWKRFVASQMRPAEQKLTTVDTAVAGADSRIFTFRTTATETVFQGFLKIYDFLDRDKDDKTADDADEDEFMPTASLSELVKDQKVLLLDAKSDQKFTEPPPRYSESMLIKALEANGIGRPSTYATIVNTIQQRKYVDKLKGKLIPTELGFKVNDFLVANLGDLFQIGFTAEMELKLDKIEEGEVQWQKMLEEFYGSFSGWVGEAKTIGAPEKDKAEKIVHLFDGVQTWKAPEKKGRRTYDDKKFAESVKSQFDKNGGISERQWSALIRMSAQYKDQIPDLDSKLSELGASQPAEGAAAGGSIGPDGQPVPPEDMGKYKEVMELLAAVKPDEPGAGRGGRKFDDKKFILSIKSQVDGGRNLSPKQINAVKKLTAKYKDQIPNFEDISVKLSLNEPAAGADGKTEAPSNVNVEEIQKILTSLSTVTAWEQPVKKGFRTFNDKSFFQSLEKQFNAKRNLSAKQVAALNKMAGKYIKEQN